MDEGFNIIKGLTACCRAIMGYSLGVLRASQGSGRGFAGINLTYLEGRGTY